MSIIFDKLNSHIFFDKNPLFATITSMNNKHTRFWWALYDFGNSIAIIVFYVFFPIWFVKVKGGADTLYNWAFILSSILFLIFAPYLGSLADRKRTYLKGLFWATIATGICYLGVSIATIIPGAPIWLCFSLFTLAFFLYQLTFVYYTPLLKYLSDSTDGENKKQQLETNSGIGQSANYIGQVVGLLLALPIIKGVVSVFGNTSISAPFLPLTAIFLIISLFAFYKIKKTLGPVIERSLIGQTTENLEEEYSSSYVVMIRNIKGLFSIKGVTIFFITYLLMSDAVLTFAGNYSLYLTTLFPETSSSQITYITLGILTMSAIGAYIFGKITHRIGSYKALLVILMGWLIMFLVLILAQSFIVHLIGFLIAGFFLGPVWVVTRVILIEKVPESKLGIASSIYTLAERFSTFVGPLFWSASLSLFAHTGATRYKYAIGSLFIVVIIAFILWVKAKPKTSI